LATVYFVNQLIFLRDLEGWIFNPALFIKKERRQDQ